MNVNKIKSLQKAYGFTAMQNMIDSGTAWTLEGSVGREAMALLESGACMLPKVIRIDYYGNRVPSRDVLKPGTKGTFKNAQEFWRKVEEGTIVIDDDAEFE